VRHSTGLPELDKIVSVATVRGLERVRIPELVEDGAHSSHHFHALHGQTSATFYGRCFQCNYTSHSQKHCPLRYCTQCGTYGHSEVVCNKDRRKWVMPAADRVPPPPV
jgi:hypothetical protein